MRKCFVLHLYIYILPHENAIDINIVAFQLTLDFDMTMQLYLVLPNWTCPVLTWFSTVTPFVFVAHLKLWHGSLAKWYVAVAPHFYVYVNAKSWLRSEKNTHNNNKQTDWQSSVWTFLHCECLCGWMCTVQLGFRVESMSKLLDQIIWFSRN